MVVRKPRRVLQSAGRRQGLLVRVDREAEEGGFRIGRHTEIQV